MREHKKLTFVCLYGNYSSTFETLPDAVVGRLIRALLTYLNTGEEIPLKGVAFHLWPSLRDQFLRDREVYERRCEQNRRNAQRGRELLTAEGDGQAEDDPEEDTQATDSNRCILPAKSAKEKEKEKEKENEKEKEINRGESIAAAPPRPRFSKPSVEDIRGYCLEKDFAVEPEAIWDYYEAKGWKVGTAPMKDWKAAVRNWMRKEVSHGRIKKPAAPNACAAKYGTRL